MSTQHPKELLRVSGLRKHFGNQEILKGIDHDNFRFKYMCIENRSIEKLKEYLAPLNYVLVEALSPYDFLFKDTRD